ncbi:NAD(P)-binding protein [Saccharata proteae CBS 121410]|uniref:NAD(P)-binding protein n=1 Tax=Saccharata proteae CBS 121410 TaxID=1314787 RepID=A0A9P4I2A2_9PEZI|nr:NAD(P)-binding protein [Saccharata proteae CBS 121410]
MSSEKKLLVIIGATGLQGGAIARTFSTHPLYRVRAITRDPSSAKALALTSLGIEVVAGNLFDETSLRSAFAGASAIFLVTDGFSGLATGNFDPNQEFLQGKLAVDVAAELPALEHFVFSSGPSVKEATAGMYADVLHYENKAAVTRYLREEKGALAHKTTVLWVGGYFQNWTHMPGIFGPVREEGGGWVQRVPWGREMRLGMVDVGDLGVVVRAVLERGEQMMGKTVFVVGEESVSQGQMLDDFGKLLNVPVRFEQIPMDAFYEGLKGSGMPDHFAVAVRDIFQAYNEFGTKLYDAPGLILGPGEKLRNWEEYVASADWSWTK